MKLRLIIALALSIIASPQIALAGDYTMAPDGSYVSGDSYNMAPDGSYVSGDSYNMAPDGSYVGQ